MSRRMTYKQAQQTVIARMFHHWPSAWEIAKRLTGTYDYQGMINELMALSGQQRMIQAIVNKIITGWTVTERQYGDGTSVYGLYKPYTD